MPLISSDRLRFQVLLVAVNLALSVAVVAAAGADATRIARPMSFYMLSIVLSNAVIYMVATPLWLRARAMEDARLERRAAELDAAKDYVVWQWRFDTMPPYSLYEGVTKRAENYYISHRDGEKRNLFGALRKIAACRVKNRAHTDLRGGALFTGDAVHILKLRR